MIEDSRKESLALGLTPAEARRFEESRDKLFVEAGHRTGNRFDGRSAKPTFTELADLLDELTRQGMPPRLQAHHLTQRWPGMVRKEED